MTDPQHKAHSARVARQIGRHGGPQSGVLGSIWGWLNGIANGVAGAIAGPLAASTKASRIALQQVARNEAENYKTWLRGVTWLWRGYFAWVIRLARHLRAVEQAQRQRSYAQLARLIHTVVQVLMAYSRALVRFEARARRREVARAEHLARQWDRHLHQTIEREAASGYRAGYQARLGVLGELLDLAVNRDPLLRDVVGRIAGGLLDLASIDDPAARWLLGFLLREVIDRLGVDKAIGDLISQLLAPLIGQPQPRNLHDVIADISQRLGSLEGNWATFMADGGPQIEQAGKDWADISSLAGDAAIVGFAALAVTEPAAWAAGISDTFGTVLNGAAAAVADLLRKA